jgi:hypothetical protein
MCSWRGKTNKGDRTMIYHRAKMRNDVARGNRICQLCENPIRKGQKCYSMWVSGRVYATAVHIHKSHCKPTDGTKCVHRAECVTGEYECKSVLCKYRRDL